MEEKITINNILTKIWWKIKGIFLRGAYWSFMQCDCCDRYFLRAEYYKVPYNYDLLERGKYTWCCEAGMKPFRFQRLAETWILVGTTHEDFMDDFKRIWFD